ncbi:hypothetical protein [Blastococcus aggregatus]|uniref:hypothetical protein n=1 Tax=Blastococcus aggregatus TaxID=38502 RepID=UPI0011417317|nr:hypothetical protein [Blastococcus aggregatus]
MKRTESRSAALLPPVTLTPEEAAAVAVALAAQPEGPYAGAGRHALEKVLTALEPDPRRRAELQAAGERSRHPAGRALRPRPEAQRPPRLVLLPGGRAS